MRLPFAACMLASAVAAAEPTPIEAQAICKRHEPECDWVMTFGVLERVSMARALAAKHLEVEPMPWDKTIEKIEVYNEDPFAESGKAVGLLRFFNHFHVTTRDYVTRGELTIGVGEVWDQTRIEESQRRLRDPLYTSVVAIIPTKGSDDKHVVLLAVTRDIFSLRLNTNYTFAQGNLTNLSFSLSENNFLGTHDLVAAAVAMDLGAIAVGPLFVDKNLMGKHIEVRVSASEVVTRQKNSVIKINPDGSAMQLAPPVGDSAGLEDAHTLHGEGNNESVSVTKTLWSLASEWGWGVSMSHSEGIARRFVGVGGTDVIGLRGYDNPDTAEVEALPQEYRIKTYSAGANVVRQWGTDYKQQFQVGYGVSSTAPSLLPNFAGDATAAAAFTRDVLPRHLLDSAPFVDYSVFEPRFKTLRNIGTYDLSEDARFGPDFDVSLTQGLQILGSDVNFTRASIGTGYTFPWCHDGTFRLSGSASVRLEHGDLIDNTASVTTRAVTPTRWIGRLVAQASLFTRWNDTQNSTLTLGGNNGLRGYAVNTFFVSGDGRALTTVLEARTRPVRVWVLRLGGVAFYEAAGLSRTLGALEMIHDVGFGARFLIPQSSRELFRFDLAFPLTAAGGEQLGNFHFTAGFDSYF